MDIFGRVYPFPKKVMDISARVCPFPKWERMFSVAFIRSPNGNACRRSRLSGPLSGMRAVGRVYPFPKGERMISVAFARSPFGNACRRSRLSVPKRGMRAVGRRFSLIIALLRFSPSPIFPALNKNVPLPDN
jgi:hypothetical protein